MRYDGGIVPKFLGIFLLSVLVLLGLWVFHKDTFFSDAIRYAPGQIIEHDDLPNNSAFLARIVPASESTRELAARYGNEIEALIQEYAPVCARVRLPLPDIRTFQHVSSGHMFGGSRLMRYGGRLRTVFNQGEDWIALGIQAWHYGIESAPGVKTFDVGHSIGKSLMTHAPTSVVRIVVRSGRWITVYPLS